MIFFFIFSLFLISNANSQLCQQCGNRRMMQFSSYPQRNYNFNFEKFFSQFPGFTAPESSPPPPSPSSPSRIFNTYGQDAEAFGSAIGKSIGQRIQQALSQQDPTYDIQFTPPTSPASSPSTYSSSPFVSTSYASISPSTSSSYQTSSYGSSIPSSYPTTSWPSTHPPEDLPTVQQAFQAQQKSYGSTPSMPQSFSSHSNGFGGMPGLLPPPQSSDCPWCSQNGGYRGKRIPNEKEQEEKKDEKV
ncbi:unnamed protein product [Caenorhabditis brenneri]